ncbi:MAG: entericidin [Pseudomonadota bacterium]
MRVLLLLSVVMALAACNTVQGVGRDIESIGKKGEDLIDGE